MPPRTLERHEVAARIVNEAGGRLVGRTRLQKVACLAKLAGLLDDFDFEYRHYGPFSEALAGSMDIAAGLRLVSEEEHRADWGGWYSVYSATDRTPPSGDDARQHFITEAAKIGPIALELAATAAYLNRVESLPADQAWSETARRKPEKAAANRLAAARAGYEALRHLPTPIPLPELP